MTFKSRAIAEFIMVNSSKPLVSVLLVTFNFEQYIRQSLDSILEQDYENLEIVVCDDCSTDRTRAIVEEYKCRYPEKIILSYTETNVGTTRNLNAGLAIAHGKYWALTSGDDLFFPGKLSTQVEYMERNTSCVICYTDQIVFDSSKPGISKMLSSIETPREGSVYEVARYGTFCGGSAMLVRVKSPKVQLRLSIKYSSDWLFLFDCLKSGGTIDYIARSLGGYRRHPDNVTVRKGFRNNLDMIRSAAIIAFERPNLFIAVLMRVIEGSVNVIARTLKGKSFYNLQD